MGSIWVGTREPARPGSATMARAAVSTDPTTNLEGRTRRRPYAGCATIARQGRRAGRCAGASRSGPTAEPAPPRQTSRHLSVDASRIDGSCSFRPVSTPTENCRAGRCRRRRVRAPERAHLRCVSEERRRNAGIGRPARRRLTALNERRRRLRLGRSLRRRRTRRSRRRSGRGCPRHPGRAASPRRGVRSRWRSRAAR